MLTRLIASAVASVAVFASGVLVANSHTTAGAAVPKPAAKAGSCCYPGSECCYPGSECCFTATDCCAAGLPCCETGEACCATKTVAKTDAPAKAARTSCCGGGECCFPPQECCAAK
jgi:hypothetical protein